MGGTCSTEKRIGEYRVYEKRLDGKRPNGNPRS